MIHIDPVDAAPVDAGPAPSASPREVAERAARHSYGRLVAYLSARSHDIASAEDALSEAFATALEKWPQEGVPDNPDAWLLTVARHRQSDTWRHAQVVAEAIPELLTLTSEAFEQADRSTIPDERLKLLFICAHPAIDAAARTPLMLQTVLGLDVARMAGAFLTAPTTLGQRLVRAKSKIRTAGIPFEAPRAAELPARLMEVLDAIYAAYGTGWEDIDGADSARRGLTLEAIELGALLAELLPTEAEAHGLLALMCFCEARAPARRGAAGRYVPLSEQDTSQWRAELIDRAELHLVRAAGLAKIGPYQLEAAIQSAHCQRRCGPPVPARHLAQLYDALVNLRPRIGALVSRASAHGEAFGSEAALAAFAQIDADMVRDYQPYWAALAHWQAAAGLAMEARAAYERAIGLSQSEAARAFLLQRAGLLARAEPSDRG